MKFEEDFALHDPAPAHDIDSFNKAYKEDEAVGGGPNIEDLQIDMRGQISSPWNKVVAAILLRELRMMQTNEPEAWDDLPERCDQYFLKMIKKKLERGRNVWRKAQPKMKTSGHVETIQEVEVRMNKDKTKQGQYSRATARRRGVSLV